MPAGIRGRLAIASGAILLAALLVYAAISRSIYTAATREEHNRTQTAALLRDAERLATRIVTGYDQGLVVTVSPPAEAGIPGTTPFLRMLADEAGALSWVFERRSFLIYSSRTVRAFPEVDRLALDSVARVIPASSSISMVQAGTDYGAIRATRFATAPTRVAVQGRTLMLAAVAVEYYLPGVNRVVLGRYETPPPRTTPGLVLPFFLLLPFVALAAFASAALYARIALAPAEARVDRLISEVTAITDGRSLHRRLPTDAEAGGQLVQLAHTLNAMLGRLETSFAALRRFTADASHELKTPLTVLRADVERAMGTGAAGKRHEQLEALEEALAEITRMADLVDSLLTLARADEGRFDLYREPVDLEPLAREVYETALLLGEGPRINVRMDAPPHVSVLGDRGRLRQLMLNLVTNAIKYTPAGGSVELALSASGGTAQFSVRDSGIGIAAADLPHVFERFWRADPARSRVGERGGVGLGLAISHYIAHAHGGSLTVTSRLGRGSTFTVSLPVHEPQLHDSAPETNA